MINQELEKDNTIPCMDLCGKRANYHLLKDAGLFAADGNSINIG